MEPFLARRVHVRGLCSRDGRPEFREGGGKWLDHRRVPVGCHLAAGGGGRESYPVPGEYQALMRIWLQVLTRVV